MVAGMAVILSIVLGFGLVIAWLGGTQIGRVVILLPLAGTLGILIGGLAPLPAGQPYNWPAFWIGVALAWPISGVPRYYAAWANKRAARWSTRRA
jgi:hypothetical protein